MIFVETFFSLLDAHAANPIDEGERFLVAKCFPRCGQYIKGRPQHRMRFDELHDRFFALCVRHLGAPASTTNASVVEQGAELSQQYFADPWSKSHEYDQKALCKQRNNKELVWFEPFRLGFLMSLLANRLDVATTLADWTESWMVPEPVAIPFDPLLGKFYLALASDFRRSQLEDRAEMEQAIAKSRKKEPKLLYATWQAVRDADQAAFEAAFQASLEHFEKTFTPTVVAYEYIALNQSILLAAARHRGRALPALTRRQQARLLTHESLNLSAPTST